jgi:octaprenyl-diphosphate synthase
MEALDRFIDNQVDCFEPEIREMAAYCLKTTGKRLRPTLVFASGWQGDGVVAENLVKAAGVVEMVHLATLVHDDIMDRADVRRNRPTAAREFGPDAAVLLGDALFSQALHIAAQFPTPEVCRLVAGSTRKVCSGEIMQTLRRRDPDISRADYWRMIDLKTAELFRVSCFLGAKLSEQPADFAEAADSFGHHLGIAYQIYDDLADFVGDESRIGKTLGTDFATGKMTLPLMLMLEQMPLEERNVMIGALRSGNPATMIANGERMKELGIAERVALAVDEELQTALEQLAPFASLAPTPLMEKLAEMLKMQITTLQTRA